MEKETHSFPTEEVILPSKGILYSKDSPLSKGVIEIKYMTAKEEDILTNQNYINNATVIDKLLQSLIVTPINYDDLLIGDKNAILVAARILGYGANYEFEWKGQQVSIDLTKLKEQEINKYLAEEGKNEFLAQDARSFRKHVKSIGGDIDLNVDIEMPDGTHEESVSLPIGISFFWPDAEI